MGDWYVNRRGVAFNLDHFACLFVTLGGRSQPGEWSVVGQVAFASDGEDTLLEGPFDTLEEAAAALGSMVAPTVVIEEAGDGPTELDGQLDAIAAHALRDRVGR